MKKCFVGYKPEQIHIQKEAFSAGRSTRLKLDGRPALTLESARGFFPTRSFSLPLSPSACARGVGVEGSLGMPNLSGIGEPAVFLDVFRQPLLCLESSFL